MGGKILGEKLSPPRTVKNGSERVPFPARNSTHDVSSFAKRAVNGRRRRPFRGRGAIACSAISTSRQKRNVLRVYQPGVAMNLHQHLCGA
jgi:hypothetical protein